MTMHVILAVIAFWLILLTLMFIAMVALNKEMLYRTHILTGRLLELVNLILRLFPATSATLTFRTTQGATMPATILVGKTATSLFQEWTGPNGTGTVVPNAGTIAYTSNNTAVASVDPVSGIATGVSIGVAVIVGTDPVNSLTANDTLTVTAPASGAVSATLSLTAN